MSYIRGVGYSQYLVEPDGRTFTMGGLEIDPETLEPLQKEPVIVIKPEDEAIPFTEPDKKYKCDICGASFDKAIALSGHSRSHKKEG